MKKQIIFLISTILLIALVSATVTQTYTASEATINLDGSISVSSNPVKNFSAFGLVCQDLSCSTTSSIFLQQKSSGSSNFLTATYPTKPQSEFGYGIFFYKEDYIPTELTANWFGSGNAGNLDIILSKKQICSSEATLSLPQKITEGDTLQLNFTINSPIKNSGPVNNIPNELKSHFEAEVSHTIEIINLATNQTITSESKTEEIKFSDSKDKNISWTSQIGDAENYQAIIKTFVPDSKCLASKEKTAVANFQVLHKPLNITQILTSPQLPLTNNGSQQEILIDFNSNFFPVDIELNLLNSQQVMVDTQGPFSKTSSTQSISYNIPKDLVEGNYTLRYKISGNNGQIIKELGNITVKKDSTTPSNLVENLSVSPQLPITTNGSLNLNIDFTPLISPLSASFNLQNKATGTNYILPQTQQNITSSFNHITNIPGTIPNGTYELNMILSTKDQSQIQNINLGDIILARPKKILEITNLTSIPQLPFTNNGSQQEILIDFNSNFFPVDIEFNLLLGQTKVHTQPLIEVKDEMDIPTKYILPGNLQDGNYTLQADITSGDSITMEIGKIIVLSPQQPQLDLFIISPENITYQTNKIPITISAMNEDSIWFSTDSGINETFISSIEKTFSEGQHTLTAHTNSSQGQVISKQVTFIIDIKDNSNGGGGSSSSGSSSSTRSNIGRFSTIELNPSEIQKNKITPAIYEEYIRLNEPKEETQENIKDKKSSSLILIILLMGIVVLLLIILIALII